MKYLKCKHCGKVLDNLDLIGFSENGDQTWKFFNSDGEIVWERNEFYSGNDAGVFYCKECGKEIRKDYNDMVGYLDKLAEEEEKREKDSMRIKEK